MVAATIRRFRHARNWNEASCSALFPDSKQSAHAITYNEVMIEEIVEDHSPIPEQKIDKLRLETALWPRVPPGKVI